MTTPHKPPPRAASRSSTTAPPRRGLWVYALGLPAFAALGYAAICGFMYAKQRDFVYFPQVTRVAAQATDFELARGGAVLRGWVLNPGQARALLYFGGNAEAIEHNREAFAAWFPDHTVYLLAYRGYGASDGNPSEAALVGDALALHDFAAARHPGIDVIGRSLGSGVAAQLAARRPVRRLALVTPFDSLVGVAGSAYPWLPVGRLMQDRFDSARHLADYRGEVLVVQASADEVIRAAHTRRLVEALPRAPRVLTLAGARHNGFDARPEYAGALTAFFDVPAVEADASQRDSDGAAVDMTR
ncbi:alpha/beta hydrolase [Marilutibacter maris]|uniref:alpha/beta hydrolase n=1 Tax=Marilutibacter maris TaxID=1605891 RepID=UPI002011D6D8|nr:lysophospholipase [Lysobacter maris]